MRNPKPSPGQQVLLCRILDSLYINGRDCLRIPLQGQTDNVQLLSLRVCGKPQIQKPTVQAQGRSCILCAALHIPLIACVLSCGQTMEIETSLCLSFCRATRLRPDQNPEFTAQCRVTPCGCHVSHGCLQIDVEVKAVLYATALCVSALPAPPPVCEKPDFDLYCQLPLYPGMLPCDGCLPYYPYPY